MQSVLHHIHQRWGLRARRLLARSKDLYKWVQHQLKAAITTGKTISNNCYEGLYCKSHLEKHKHDSAGSEPVYIETNIKIIWFLKESHYSRDRVICFNLQTRSVVSPQHWCLCTSVHTVKESDEHMYGLWTYEEGYFSYFFMRSDYYQSWATIRPLGCQQWHMKPCEAVFVHPPSFTLGWFILR